MEPVNPLTQKQQAEVLFLLALLEDSFGGNPSIGLGVDSRAYVVVSTCPCRMCKQFRDTYPMKEAATVLAAAKLYGDDRICFFETKDMEKSGKAVRH